MGRRVRGPRCTFVCSDYTNLRSFDPLFLILELVAKNFPLKAATVCLTTETNLKAECVVLVIGLTCLHAGLDFECFRTCLGCNLPMKL